MKSSFRLIFWASLLALTACGAGSGKEDSNPPASSVRPTNSVSSATSSSAVSSLAVSSSSSSLATSSSSSVQSSVASTSSNSSSQMSSSSRSTSRVTSSSSRSSSSLVSSLSSQASSVSSSFSSDPGIPGVWQNVTSPDLNMSPDFNPAGNYGVISIMVDPVRPSDLYASVCYQGLWKSTDYGLTWIKINTGTNSDKIDAGRPSMAIDPNPNRDPATPPTFYSNSLYGASGLWKSTNGGRDWADIWTSVRASDGITDIKDTVGTDVGVPVVDPLDSQHLIIGMHGSMTHADHIFESTNGGGTWIDRGPVGMTNLSVFLIDRTSWIVQGDYFASGNTRKTTNSGASWTIVGPDIAHPHGGSSLLNLGGGELYIAGIAGLYHSINNGDSWQKVPNSTDTSVIVATPTRIYTSYGWAWLAGVPPTLGHLDRPGNTWVADPAPEQMINGGIEWVVTRKGTQHIIVGANYNAGIWRYVEPTNASSSSPGSSSRSSSSPISSSSRSSSSSSSSRSSSMVSSSSQSSSSSSSVSSPNGSPPGETDVWKKLSLPNWETGDFCYVLADPVNPSKMVAGCGNNDGRKIKWYNSTNYGDNWVLVNNTAMNGSPWGMSIDPNPERNPATTPVIYAPAGYGSAGIWKSADMGSSWTRLTAADTAFAPYNFFNGITDLYHTAILPDDPPNHLLVTYHYGFKDVPNNEGGFGESWDGGQTWVIHQPPAGIGSSHYVIPISGTTFCVISQESDRGIWRSTTAGRLGGTKEQQYRDGFLSTLAWEKVNDDNHAHVHGSYGPIKLGNTWYSPGYGGILEEGSIWKSYDDCATWTNVVPGYWWPSPPNLSFHNKNSTGLAATDKYIYSNSIVGAPELARAPRDNESYWSRNYTTTPADMVYGSNPMATFAIKHSSGYWMVFMGTGDGIWRYIEP